MFGNFIYTIQQCLQEYGFLLFQMSDFIQNQDMLLQPARLL